MKRQVAIVLSLFGTGCIVGDDPDGGIDVDAFAKTARVTIVQHNVEKTGGAVDNAVQEAQAANAVGITLEEVCPNQLADLRQQHGDWTIGAVPQKHTPNTGCDLPGGGHAIPNVVVIWTGGPNGTVDPPYSALGAPADAPGEMVCVQFKQSGVPVHLCAAHLISTKFTTGGVTYDAEAIRKHQTSAIATTAHAWVKAKHFAIIGGDFNAQPSANSLDNLYAAQLGGTGDFTEYNRSPGTREGVDTAHSDGSNTSDGLPYSKKIDYLFFSTNRAPLNGPGVSLHKDASDHDMLTSSAPMDKK